MQGQTGTADTLHAIVDAAAHIVPGVRWAGISMIQGHRVVAVAPTDPIVAKLDELQSELGDGPCINRTERSPHRPHRRYDDRHRWPQFACQATELGVKSLLSFQLFVQRENLGALNLYSTETGMFSEDSVEIGTVLAQHAAVALVGAAAENHFQAALASRDVMGSPKAS